MKQGERAFFRLSFPVTTLPLTATLWVDADQAVTPYLNGFRVAAPPELPPYAAQANLAPAATGQAVPEQVDTLDLLPALGRGMNTVGLEVVNLANRPPSFQARVELNFGAGTVVMGTRPGDWLSTTNVALTAEAFPESGTFSRPDVSTAGWVGATSAPAWSDRRLVGVPGDAYTTPTDGHVLASDVASGLLTASTVVRVPPGCSQAWVRVAATGPYDLSINGQVIAQAPGGHGTFGSPDSLGRAVGGLQKPYTLAAYQVCGLLPVGAVRVAVSVDAGFGTQAMLYVDGLISTPRRKTTFATGPAWASASGAKLAVLDHPRTAFDADLQVVPGHAALPAGRYVALRLGDSAWALLVAAGALGLALVLGAPRRRAAASVALGVLPAASLVVFLDETKHLNFVYPPFPATPSSLLAVTAAFISRRGVGRSPGPARPAPARRQRPGPPGPPGTGHPRRATAGARHPWSGVVPGAGAAPAHPGVPGRPLAWCGDSGHLRGHGRHAVLPAQLGLPLAGRARLHHRRRRDPSPHPAHLALGVRVLEVGTVLGLHSRYRGHYQQQYRLLPHVQCRPVRRHHPAFRLRAGAHGHARAPGPAVPYDFPVCHGPGRRSVRTRCAHVPDGPVLRHPGRRPAGPGIGPTHDAAGWRWPWPPLSACTWLTRCPSACCP